MTRPRSWVEAILAAGPVPASHRDEASLGHTDPEEFTGADPVEDRDVRVHPLAGVPPLMPGATMSTLRVCEVSAADAGQPARALPAARLEVQKVRPVSSAGWGRAARAPRRR